MNCLQLVAVEEEIFELNLDINWRIQGGTAGMPPHRIQFFRFCICFCQKAPILEVDAPQRLGAPPMGNPGSATDI